MSGDPSPLLVLGCDGCATAYQATGEQATTLRAIPARAAYLAQAGQYAEAAGWRVDSNTGACRCPRCRERYGDTGTPRRYTLREVALIHRDLT